MAVNQVQHAVKSSMNNVRSKKMKYCEECGEKLEENSKFCEKCGRKVESDSNAGPSPVENTGHTVQKAPRKPLSKKQKMIIGGIGAAVILAFAGYKVGENVYSEENQRAKLIETISSGDADELAKALTTTDPNFEVTAENLEPFATYLEENPKYLSDLISGLETGGSYDSLYIRKNGSRLFFYDNYDMTIAPVYAQVYTNAEGVIIASNDAELATSDSEDFTKEIGPFAPGEYHFTANGDISGNSLSVARDEVLLYPGSYYEIDLSLQGMEFDVYSDLIEATVYLDDKEIGKLDEEGYGSFGPIQFKEGQTIHVAKKAGEEEIVSESVELTEDNSYYSFDDLQVADADDLYYALDYMYNSVSGLTSYYDESYESDLSEMFVTDSPAYEEQRVQFITFAKEIYDNEEMDSVLFDVEVKDYEQTGVDKFDVSYEVTYTSVFDYSTSKEDELKTYTKDATILFVETDDSTEDYKYYDGLIYDISNEKLVSE